VQGSLGAQLGSRLWLGGEGFYVVDGADRGDGRLRLTSGALLGVVRFAVLHHREPALSGKNPAIWAGLSATGGFGKYFLSETFVDSSLSPTVYKNSAGSLGGFLGVEGAFHLAALRIVIAYGYHIADAGIADRVRGSVHAGGHELSFGLGVSL
jgi:hypothetical protein